MPPTTLGTRGRAANAADNREPSPSRLHHPDSEAKKAQTDIKRDSADLSLQERIETVGDDADLQEVYDTERHLLYVACTRAKDHLFVTSVEPKFEFLDDLLT